MGVGAVLHRRRRDPLGQEAHARRRGGRPERHAARRPTPRTATWPSRTSLDGDAESSGFVQCKMIRRTLIGALAADRRCPPSCCSGPRPDCPARKLRHTIWTKGTRIVTDADAARRFGPRTSPSAAWSPCVPETLAKHRGGRGHPERPRRRPPVILVRHAAGGDPARSRATDWDYQGILALLQDLHARGLPDRACTSSRPTTCSARATSRRSTWPTPARSSSGRRPGRCPSCAITVDDEGYLVAAERLHRARRPELLGARMSTTRAAVEPRRPAPPRRPVRRRRAGRHQQVPDAAT